jgi:hypothetical protein
MFALLVALMVPNSGLLFFLKLPWGESPRSPGEGPSLGPPFLPLTD